MNPVIFTILFEPRDLWIGVYWDARYMWNHYDYEKPKKMFMTDLTIYVCIIPMLPLRIVIHAQQVKKQLKKVFKKGE